MGLHTIKILGISITTDSKEKILEEIQKGYLLDGSSSENRSSKTPKMVTIVTPNPEIVMVARANPVFSGILNQADVALPDGIGLVFATRILHLRTHQDSFRSLSGVIHGVDCMEDLVSFATKKRIPVGLIGGREGVALKALECLKQNHPELSGWAFELPDIPVSVLQRLVERKNPDSDDLGGLRVLKSITSVLEKMDNHSVGMLFIALGAPKQEYVLELLRRQWSKRIQRRRNGAIPSGQLLCMGVGGAFDMIAGTTPRAPGIMRFLYLEWLWRLFLEPARIRRQWNLVRFVGTVVFQPVKTL